MSSNVLELIQIKAPVDKKTSEPLLFNRYSLLMNLEVTFTVKQPLRIGRGRDDTGTVGESDLPIIKDASDPGVPIIPGSSLKGFYRAHIERILRTTLPNGDTLKDTDIEILSNKLFGGTEPKEPASCFLFFDLRPKSINPPSYRVETRTHIRINPQTGAVRNLFDAECLMDGSEFTGRLCVSRNLSPTAFSLIHAVNAWANLGIARIGGFKSRGYGLFEINPIKLELIIPGCPPSLIKRSQGYSIDDYLVGFGESVTFKWNDGELTITELDKDNPVTTKAEIKPSPQFLGTQISIKGEQVESFFNGFNEHLLKYIEPASS